MGNLLNPVTVLFQDVATGQPVAATSDTPLPVEVIAGVSTEETLAALLAIVGTAADAAGANTVIGQLKQIAINTTPP